MHTNNFSKINIKKDGGFSLVEILVAMTIFFIGTGLAINILSTTLKGQRSAFATQQVVDQSSYSLEYISRSIRMARVGTLAITRTGKGVSFTNSKSEMLEIFLDGTQIWQKKGVESPIALTSSDIEITFAEFKQNPTATPPLITIALTVKTTGTKPEENTEMKIQTSISLRNIE